MGIHGYTAVSMAIQGWKLTILEMLVQHGADLNILDKEGDSCLVQAISNLPALCLSTEEPPFLDEVSDDFCRTHQR